MFKYAIAIVIKVIPIVFLFGFGVSAPAIEKKKTLEKVWELSSNFNMPESAFFDAASGEIYVSNVGGNPTGRDGKGYISRISIEGKLLEAKWIKNLNAPKGLRTHMGKLWVADLDTLHGIDIAKGKIVESHLIPGAIMLNDIALDRNGTVYVSDTFASKIFRFKNGKAEEFVGGEDWESPNGLLLLDNTLYVATWGLTKDFSTKATGHFYAVDLSSKKRKLIGKKVTGQLDGVEKASDGKFFVSDWQAGKIWYGDQLILTGLKGSADIGYVYRRNTFEDLLLVPEMLGDKLTAYRLK